MKKVSSSAMVLPGERLLFRQGNRVQAVVAVDLNNQTVLVPAPTIADNQAVQSIAAGLGDVLIERLDGVTEYFNPFDISPTLAPPPSGSCAGHHSPGPGGGVELK